MTVAPAVRISGLGKRYGDVVALDGVDLTVAPGELRGLLGPNGAGKTTLLRTLFGLVRPDCGTIELLGRALRDDGRPELGGIAGFVEEPAFYGYLSAQANLEVLAELDDGVPTSIGAVLDRVGLARRARDRVSGFSTGMRQRLGIAAALLRKPRLLLLDEPTSGLDPAGIRAVEGLLRGLSADGVAVVLSSHLIGELESLCDSYTILRDGRVVWDGTADALEVQAPGSVFLLATSDDGRAAGLAGDRVGVAREPTGLHLTGDREALDDFVRALVTAGLSIYRLELLVSPLESMFFSVTATEPTGPRTWLEAKERARDEAAALP